MKTGDTILEVEHFMLSLLNECREQGYTPIAIVLSDTLHEQFTLHALDYLSNKRQIWGVNEEVGDSKSIGAIKFDGVPVWYATGYAATKSIPTKVFSAEINTEKIEVYGGIVRNLEIPTASIYGDMKQSNQRIGAIGDRDVSTK